MKRGRLAASFGPGAPRSRSSSRVLECNGSQRLPPQESEPVWVVPLYGRILLLSSTHTRSAPGSVANYQMGKFYGMFWRLTPVGVKFPKFGHVWSSKMSNLVQNFIWSWTKSVILAKIAPSSRYLVNNSTLGKVMGQLRIIQLFIIGPFSTVKLTLQCSNLATLTLARSFIAQVDDVGIRARAIHSIAVSPSRLLIIWAVTWPQIETRAEIPCGEKRHLVVRTYVVE